MAFFSSVAIRIAALAVVTSALLYGEDPVAALSRRIEQGAVQLAFQGPYGYLPSLLEALHVPVESQMAVFSKTSIQSLHIEPSNPRVLYFNDAVSVGWVRGGFIELAAQDPGHDIRYYILQQKPDAQLTRREDCVRCHKSGALQIHSVVSTPDGIPSQEAEVDSRTPFGKLWGGWFVTGAGVPSGHMGNAVSANSERREIAPVLGPKVAITSFSDIVALSVFAHQMRVMNLLAHPDNIGELVDALLFVDDAPLPGSMWGDSGFAEKFSTAEPRDHLGRSLRQFDLEHRLMRYPCSYMIYSDAFDALAATTKESVYRRMSAILSGADKAERYSRLTLADRKAVVEILRDTKPGLPSWFGL